jgi:hypothetical protein
MENKTLEKRFWSKVKKTSGCWIWTGATNSCGYGDIWATTRLERAHRVSWFFAHGPIPEGKLVLHKCDNPPCVNPDHLFLGTHRDNTQDMFKKNRANKVRGEGHPLTFFTEDQVIELRRRYGAGEDIKLLAKEFNTTRDSIYPAVSGRTWKHLPGAIKRGLPKGAIAPFAKLTDESVIEAHKRIKNGESINKVAQELGCSGVALGNAVNGKTWKHLNLSPLNLKTAKGSRQHRSKLTDDQIRGIRELHAKGVTMKVIANIYSVSQSTVCNIISGKRWSHVT